MTRSVLNFAAIVAFFATGCATRPHCEVVLPGSDVVGQCEDGRRMRVQGCEPDEKHVCYFESPCALKSLTVDGKTYVYAVRDIRHICVSR